MPDEKKLKPCPFCNGCNLSTCSDDYYENEYHIDEIVRVFCKDCSAQGPSALGEKQSAMMWNMRA